MPISSGTCPASVGLDQQIYSGVDGATQFNAEWAEGWDGWQLEVEEYLDAGERVVVIINQRGRSKASGIPAPHALRSIVDAPRRTGDQDADVRERGGSPRGRVGLSD